jgi:hypothetical protein
MTIVRPTVACLALLLLLAYPSDAWAYVDPGVGSYVFQVAIAGMLAGLYTLRRFSSAVTTFIRGRFSRQADVDAQTKRNGVA